MNASSDPAAANERGSGAPPTPNPRTDRLDSWKEIAAHFGRGVTTLQRWEREEGLPVHRLPHEKRGSVYAYRSELEAWWETRGRGAVEAAESTPDPPAPRVSRRMVLAIAGGASALGLGAYLGRGLLRTPANACRHPRNLGRDRITALAEFQGRIYAAVHQPGNGGRWAIQTYEAGDLKKASALYHDQRHVEQIVPAGERLHVVLYDPGRGLWSVYRNREGRDFRTWDESEPVYESDARVDALVPLDTGVITAFSGSAADDPCGIYFTRPGPRLVDEKGYVSRRYNGRFRADHLVRFRDGLMTAFVDERTGESQGVYYSRTGERPGVVSTGTEVAASPFVTGGQVEMLVETVPGLLAALYNPQSKKSWGIWLSPDGRTIAGGNDTKPAYRGTLRPDAMAAFGTGAVSAFFDPATGRAEGVHFSPDGLNLAGGGQTVTVYRGPLRVSALLATPRGVLAAFYDPATGEGRGLQMLEVRGPDSVGDRGTRWPAGRPGRNA